MATSRRNVYPIYMLLMCISLVLVVVPGYLILVRLLICNSKQVLQNKRKLAKNEVMMRVGNRSKVDVIAVGTLPLHLPPGLVLYLNNCYLVPALSMNIISGSCLLRDGYSFKSENNGCSIYMILAFMVMHP